MGAVRYVRWLGRNFGDDLNDLLFRDVVGITEHAGNGDALGEGTYVLGIGTLLNGYLRPQAGTRIVVFGTGAGNTVDQPASPVPFNVLFVRGPLTCDYLGWPRSLALCDGAYALADRFVAMAEGVKRVPGRVGVIPHHWSLETFPARWVSQHEQAVVIDPHQDVASFVRAVAACETVVGECLHGAICADILRIPFVVAPTAPIFHSFKWVDWAAGMGFDLRLGYVDYPDLLRRGAPRRLDAMLSSDAVLAGTVARALARREELVRLVKDLGGGETARPAGAVTSR